MRIVFQSVVSLSDGFAIFVHEEDDNEHIMFGFVARGDDKPAVKPARRTIIDLSTMIQRDRKPGVYALQKISFQTFGGKDRGYRGDVGTPKFEVIPEMEFAPIVQDVSIYTEAEWRTIKRHE